MTQPTTKTIGHRAARVSRVLSLAVFASACLPACLGFQFTRAPSAPMPSATQPTPGAAAAESAASLANLRAAKPSGGAFATVKSNTRSASCGAAGQRPCYVWEAIPSCNAGLAEDLLAHKCVPSGPSGALETSARGILGGADQLVAAVRDALTCFRPGVVEAAVKRSDLKFAKQLGNGPCVKRLSALAKDAGFATLTIGVSGGGALVVGGFVDTGFAYDTDGDVIPTLYQTKAFSIGFQAGGGVALNIGLYKGSNAVNTAGVDAHGFSFEAGVGGGAGAGVWFTYQGGLDGISVSAIAGASGKAGAYNRVNTSYYDLDGNNPMVCGGNNQRACKVHERIPSCDRGLYEDLKKGTCRRPDAFACGGRGESPCKLWERIPSCNPGLAEYIFEGRCR